MNYTIEKAFHQFPDLITNLISSLLWEGFQVTNLPLLLDHIQGQVEDVIRYFRETEEDSSLEAFKIRCIENQTRHNIYLFSMEDLSPDQIGIKLSDNLIKQDFDSVNHRLDQLISGVIEPVLPQWIYQNLNN